MLPQEIRDIIKKEAEALFTDFRPRPGDTSSEHYAIELKNCRKAYIAAATKYTELMIEFAEWKVRSGWEFNRTNSAGAYLFVLKFTGEEASPSDLLTIFLKEKSNLANENNIV